MTKVGFSFEVPILIYLPDDTHPRTHTPCGLPVPVTRTGSGGHNGRLGGTRRSSLQEVTDVPFTGKIDEGLERGSLKDGRSDGPWVEYHENGQLQSEGTFKDGAKVE